jgi:hypothetical protein
MRHYLFAVPEGAIEINLPDATLSAESVADLTAYIAVTMRIVERSIREKEAKDGKASS